MRQADIFYLNMVHTLLAGLEQEAAHWTSIKPMQALVAQLKSTYARTTEEARIKTSANPTGYTAEKSLRFAELTSKVLRLAKKLSAYAKQQKIAAMLPLVDYTATSLEKGPESEVLLRCRAILDEAEKRLTALSDYQVTAAEITQLRGLLEAYPQLPGERNLIRSRRVTAGQNLEHSMTSLRELLDTLDDLVEGLVSDEGLRQKYKHWRRIDRTGTGRSSPSRKENSTPPKAG